jgi:hypothetical protein
MTNGEFKIESQVGEGTKVSFKVPDSVLGVSDSILAEK